MKLIVGLGNPGLIYVNSRHNIGFSVIKTLAKKYKISFKKEKETFSLKGRGKISEDDVILAMPLTFMNLSGIAVKALLKKYHIDLANLLVILDDLDLELARLKIRPAGSSGGHRGLASIVEAVGSEVFPRLRVGIGRAKADIDTAEYVLSPFRRNQKQQVKELIEKAADCCQVWVTKGITEAMNTFNKKE